jgi:hypothetical protein
MRRGIVLGGFVSIALAGAAAPAPGQSSLDVSGNNQSINANCGGGTARISGNGNRVTLRGPCSVLDLNGSFNAVAVEMAPEGRIRVLGDANRVMWRSPGGVYVEQLGRDNDIQRTP